MTAPLITRAGLDPADSTAETELPTMVRFIDLFTRLEWVELGDAYAAGDQESVVEIFHVAEGRRELERLTEQNRLAS